MCFRISDSSEGSTFMDTRLMDLSGTRAGEIVLFDRVSQVVVSPDGVHDLQAAFMQGRQRRAVRLHSAEPLRVPVHNGDSILVRGLVDAASVGGLRLVFVPSALRAEHTHANSFDARSVLGHLSGRD